MSRQAEISAESRARLLTAAWDLLAEGGSRATTVQAVSERAGISRGSISWHFGSKEGLIVAVVNSAFDTLAENIGAAFDSARSHSWDAVIDAQSVVLSDERFRIFGTLALETVDDQGPVAAAFADGHRRIRDLYARYIAEHRLVSDGTDPADAAIALRALTLGLNIHRRFDGETISLREAFDALQAVAVSPAPVKRRARTRQSR
ncbi:TetR/AcrR family transcriptional regulator [Mycolicibacterium sp. 018/SC-01/001]|uniref:TetR/AcrR family transcriptional regulator n=1 Tax=Mycolicibacterium sp. 018/SC-01/001 TaxID=2592069 RepID=UPI00117CD1C9|nr:TetR/AcrR family transcriptional regulator [Mycolicibacterium sp. 018/SC-01/001]TRW79135.1 TetR/AcrR family transcriptional regulator [Mycolicibacterium sp. 018/SC-01/001]